VHVADIRADPDFAFPESAASGRRTVLGVPLLREGAVLGTINLARKRVEPYTERQIELVRTFADQAVIAIENARLITETREALEQQTATAEVLQVINSSPGDLAPVFDAVLDKAFRLCDGTGGSIWIFQNERIRHIASRGLSPAQVENLRRHREQPDLDERDPVKRIMRGERLIQIIDMAAEHSHGPAINSLVSLLGSASAIFVALVRDADPVGAFAIARRQTGPFSDKQIALLQNFAAQAVIAMENARLLTETREALEQQTATAEVLQVINSSPGDLAPVSDAILGKAHTLCGAPLGSLVICDGEHLRAVATRGYPAKYDALARGGFPARGSALFDRLMAGELFIHIADTLAVPLSASDHPIRHALREIAGVRSLLAVPLRRDNCVLGYISAQRQELRPFTGKEIALLQNFAAQAVIAMENARLLTETREALEQQTATAEVLQVINSSPGDFTPVFEAMLAKAVRLCDTAFGIMQTYNGERFETAALYGVPAQVAEWRERGPLVFSQGTAPARMVAGEDLVHEPDLTASEPYLRGDPNRRALVELGGARSHLIVALRKDGALLGTIAVYRQEVRPFTDKQIALLQNFAAQAVIAMENARLIGELHERTDEVAELSAPWYSRRKSRTSSGSAVSVKAV
jgi:GAF domain-containing protein